jgi:hypothetical protein
MVAAETVLVSAGVSLVVSLLSFEYRFRRERSVQESDEVSEWYAEAAQLSNRVQSTWRRKFERPVERGGFTGLSELQSEMNLLSNQLSRHASEGETLDASPEIVTGLEETADACRDVHEVRGGTAMMDPLREAGGEAVERAAEVEAEALERI